MSMKIIEWSERANFDNLGRNGFSASMGIAVSPIVLGGRPEVFLEPINSKGDIGRTRLVIPMAQIPALIEALRAAQAESPAEVEIPS